MTLFYVYQDPSTKGYEIYQTHEKGLVGTEEMLPDGRVYYFACFTRLVDASNYVKAENAKLRTR